MQTYDIFISYSRRDSDIVNKFVDQLKQAGLSVWIDIDGIESGDAFKKIIVRAIESSDTVLFFSSEHSNASMWTAKEIGVAIYEKKKVIPILIDHTRYNPEIKFDLINLDFLDLDQGFDFVMTKLLSSIQSHAGDSTDNDGPESEKKLSVHRSTGSFLTDTIQKLNQWPKIALTVLNLFCICGLVGACICFSIKAQSAGHWDAFSFGLLSLSAAICGYGIIQLKRQAYWLLISSWTLISMSFQLYNFDYWQKIITVLVLTLTIITISLHIQHRGISVWNRMSTHHDKWFKRTAIGIITAVCCYTLVYLPISAHLFGYGSRRIERGANLVTARLGGSYANYSIGNDFYLISPTSLPYDYEKAKAYYLTAIKNKFNINYTYYVNVLKMCESKGDTTAYDYIIRNAESRLSPYQFQLLLKDINK